MKTVSQSHLPLSPRLVGSVLPESTAYLSRSIWEVSIGGAHYRSVWCRYLDWNGEIGPESAHVPVTRGGDWFAEDGRPLHVDRRGAALSQTARESVYSAMMTPRHERERKGWPHVQPYYVGKFQIHRSCGDYWSAIVDGKRCQAPVSNPRYWVMSDDSGLLQSDAPTLRDLDRGVSHASTASCLWDESDRWHPSLSAAAQ